MTLLTAQLPNGQTVTRNTEKDYNFVVAASHRLGEWNAYSWTTTEATAKKRSRDAQREGAVRTEIVAIVARTAEQPVAYTPDSTQIAGQMVNVAPLVSLRIVRDAEMPVPTQVKSPNDTYAILRERFADSDREQFVVICLDTKNRVIAVNVAFIGSLDCIVTTMREIFKAACVVGAAAIIVAHNHPSGDPTPSPEDVMTTRKIVEAGQLLDIQVLDHVVMGNGRFVSLREKGLGFSH
jgi:DNA repair protein RadC